MMNTESVTVARLMLAEQPDRPPDLDVKASFHGVGQGLFSSGEIQLRCDGSDLHWVFDCGSAHGKNHASACANNYWSVNRGGAARKLDLLAISHFDTDHVNGLRALLDGTSVNTVMMPFLTLAQRLYCAAVSGIDTRSQYYGLFLNPVDYILDLAESVTRFVFVLSDDDSVFEPIYQDERPGDNIDGQFEVEFAGSSFAGSNSFESDLLVSERTAVAFTRSRVPIVAPKFDWEFLPHNDKKVLAARELTAAFRQAAVGLGDALSSGQSLDAPLARLVESYDGLLADNERESDHANLISLLLFQGSTAPIDGDQKTSILHTGDARLDALSRTHDVRNYFGNERLDSVHCLQVPHHGSRRNWHLSRSLEINPDFAVFSAEPSYMFNHPHDEVFLSFLESHPLLSRRGQGVSVEWLVWQLKKSGDNLCF